MLNHEIPASRVRDGSITATANTAQDLGKVYVVPGSIRAFETADPDVASGGAITDVDYRAGTVTFTTALATDDTVAFKYFDFTPGVGINIDRTTGLVDNLDTATFASGYPEIVESGLEPVTLKLRVGDKPVNVIIEQLFEGDPTREDLNTGNWSMIQADPSSPVYSYGAFAVPDVGRLGGRLVRVWTDNPLRLCSSPLEVI